MEELLGEDVEDLVVHARQVAEQAAEPVELPRPHPGLKLAAPEDDVLQFGVVLAFGVAVADGAGVDERGLLFVDEGGGGDEGGY